MIALINAVGLSTALEKLLVRVVHLVPSPTVLSFIFLFYCTTQPHLSHRVWRVREQVLAVLLRVVQVYGEDTLAAPDLPRQLSALLADPQSSVRQLTMDVLCDLYSVFGESMMVLYFLYHTVSHLLSRHPLSLGRPGGGGNPTQSNQAHSTDYRFPRRTLARYP